MNSRPKPIRLLTALVLLVVPIVFLVVRVSATSVSKGYQTSDTEIRTGMAVSLTADSNSDNQKVEKSSSANRDKYVGIVSDVDNSLVTFGSKYSTIFVANAGTGEVYVSDLNGEVKQGDPLVISPIKGILMKAGSSSMDTTSVAIALSDLDLASPQSKEIKLDSGETKQVSIGSINAEFGLNSISSPNKQNFLSVFGESVAGKPVSEIRVLIACVILFIILIVEGSIVYGAVSSSITAVGRNPLSKKSVYKQLTQTSILAAAILIFGCVGIYVVIWT